MSCSLIPTRSGEDWLVSDGEYVKVGSSDYRIPLKAKVGSNPDQPPIFGWQFFNFDTYKCEKDSRLSCSAPTPASSLSCCLKVSLSGAAKEAQAKCEGEYKSTGLVSMGREVISV